MYEIQFTERYVGYSVEPARGGETTQVQVRGATSTEDGDLHLKYLAAIPQQVLSMLPKKIKPSEIDSMVVIISHDLNAKVYVNEVDIHMTAMLKAIKVEKGQELTRDHISGVEKVILGNIVFPKDHAYFCVLSNGWDKVFVFDFSPLNEQKNVKIEYDVERYLGSYFSYLMFKDVHKIGDSEWDAIFSQNWFPFSALKYSSVEAMVNYVKAGWSIDDILETINTDALGFISERLAIWERSEALRNHLPFLKNAIERHVAEDYMSSISILYPNIEGLIRSDFFKCHPEKGGRDQTALANHIPDKATDSIPELTTFLPQKFKAYLERCYFKDFSPNKFTNDVSRNTVAHGVVLTESFTKKGSLIGLLIFSQIVQYLELCSPKK